MFILSDCTIQFIHFSNKPKYLINSVSFCMAFFCSNIENLPELVKSRIKEHFSVMEEKTKKDEKKKKPLLIHPRRSDMFEVPVKVARVKKGHISKQQVVMESFVKIIDTEEQWEQFLGLRSRMAVIEVSRVKKSVPSKFTLHPPGLLWLGGPL